ncbi:hypothetical protein EDD86DRAFT_205465 [Gorgonomyces haynaldii]|nr:hypothetical protein EDD86DRAFT_205465 [Gorgonomyces haynaldii]
MSSTCPGGKVTECFFSESSFCYQGRCLMIEEYCHLNGGRCLSTSRHCLKCGSRQGLCVGFSDPDYNLNCGSEPQNTVVNQPPPQTVVNQPPPVTVVNQPNTVVNQPNTVVNQPNTVNNQPQVTGSVQVITRTDAAGTFTLQSTIFNTALTNVRSDKPTSAPQTTGNADSTSNAPVIGSIIGAVLLGLAIFVSFKLYNKRKSQKFNTALENVVQDHGKITQPSSNATLLPSQSSVPTYAAGISFALPNTRYKRMFSDVDMPVCINQASVSPTGPGRLYALRKRA